MYLEANGHTLKREGSQFRHDEHDSLYIKDNQWYWFSRKKAEKQYLSSWNTRKDIHGGNACADRRTASSGRTSKKPAAD